MERNAIRSVDQKTPVTTNLMGTFKQLDYFKWAKEMDVVSWDNYPSYDTPVSLTAMQHDLMRGLKQQPFMLMEQTPSQQNWQPYNSLKKPGQMRAQSYQAIAHGADTIQFFQLRRSVGGCEKFHGAVIAHAGTDNTRVFREVTQLGTELEELGDQILGTANPADVGILFDWDNYWALEFTSGPHKDLKYVDQIHRHYKFFYEKNIAVDMIPRDADFSKYKLIVAPVLYMVHQGVKEAQTPSQQNWQPYNSLKKPGQMRAQSYQAIAHGADTIQFFQLRRSVGGCEKFHGAVIAHAGTDNTRVFREVTQLGTELEELGDQILGTANPADVGILFDWDNYWALEFTSGPHKDLKYVDQIHRHYKFFYEKNIAVDMIPRDADFSKYKLIVAPVLYMVHQGVKEALEAFVKKGGVLVTGFMSGIVGESDNVYLGGYPGPLRDLAGIWVEEIDALAPEQKNSVKFKDGTEFTSTMLCDLIHLEGAESMADYSSNFYAGTPAVTKNSYGKGNVYYLGTQPEDCAFTRMMDCIVKEAAVKSLVDERTSLEVTVRKTKENTFYFLINFSKEETVVPQCFAGMQNLLTGETVSRQEILKPFEVEIIKK